MKNDINSIKTNFKRKNINKLNSSLLYIYLNTLLLLIIYFSLFYISLEESKISLIINGKGAQNLISSHSNINYNDYEFSCNKLFNDLKKCYFENNLNNVTIKFIDNIRSFSKMFEGLANLIEIDLSNFDFSNMKDMSFMFNDCVNLKKINFGKQIISSVEKMECLFHNCKKLESIDLSSFDTSSITNMSSIFRYCESLTSIEF